MTSTFKEELKKPDSKTLKFPGEEKRRRTTILCSATGWQKSLDTVSALTAAVGFKKRDLRKCAWREKEESPIMSKIGQR